MSNIIRQDLDDLLNEYNDPTEIVTFRELRQSNIHSAIRQGVIGAPIDITAVLYEWGIKRKPYQAIYGQVAASDVAQWWKEYYPKLFAPNIRMFLGSTDVNTSLMSTIKNDPKSFWYFNNGITALCDKIEKAPIGGNTRDSGTFECHNMRIVNGAQTAGAIASASDKHIKMVEDARVPIRIISLEDCPDEFKKQVTKNTNTQNRIERRDFVALDPNQERIENELALENISYVYKSGDVVQDTNSGFDITDATIARACVQVDVSNAVQAKREIGRLWEDIEKPPYTILFNKNLDGLTLWRQVEVTRQVEKKLKQLSNNKKGRNKLMAIHGNRLITHIVFQELEITPKQKLHNRTPAAKISKTTLSSYNKVLEITNRLYPDAYLASLFKNISKCREIKAEYIKIHQS